MSGRPGKAFIDLRAVVRDQLERSGLAAANIASVGPCTRCAADRFFSRRANGGKMTRPANEFCRLRRVTTCRNANQKKSAPAI